MQFYPKPHTSNILIINTIQYHPFEYLLRVTIVIGEYVQS